MTKCAMELPQIASMQVPGNTVMPSPSHQLLSGVMGAQVL